MTLRARILTGISALLALCIVSVAVALSYEAACGPSDALPQGAQRMKAIILRCYGPPEVLTLEDVAKPIVGDDEVLVKVHAAAVNPLDHHQMTGKPYIIRMSSGLGAPEYTRLGVDFSGTVETVGKNVTRFKPGDEVFGGRGGAFAEYVTLREDQALALKPNNLTFDQAASIPVAAITALQGLRDKGGIKAGQKILINGASGGVGTFAVQIAKAFGAEVTGVCSTRNLELVRSIGADHVIDYTQESFIDREERYDLILDNVGNHSLLDIRRVLKPQGVLVIVSGPKDNPWIGPVSRWAKASVLARFVDEQLVTFVAQLNASDLQTLGDLASEGKLTPVIDRRYALSEVPEAIRYIETKRAKGKVVISVQEPPAVLD